MESLEEGGGFRREVQPRRQHWFLNEKSGFPFRKRVGQQTGCLSWCRESRELRQPRQPSRLPDCQELPLSRSRRSCSTPNRICGDARASRLKEREIGSQFSLGRDPDNKAKKQHCKDDIVLRNSYICRARNSRLYPFMNCHNKTSHKLRRWN